MSHGALGIAVAVNTAWLCVLAAWVARLGARLGRERRERLRENTEWAHELANLRSAHEIERDWYALQREWEGE